MERNYFFKALLLLSQIFLALCSICDQHPGVHPYDCCKIPSLYDEEVMSDCRVQYRDLQSLRVGSVNCFLLCALSAANASETAPRSIDGLAYTITQQYIKNEPYLANVIQNALLKCTNTTAIIKGTTGLSTKMATERYICDPNALLIRGCIAIEIFMNCPSTRASNATSCGTLRQYLNECRPY